MSISSQPLANILQRLEAIEALEEKLEDVPEQLASQDRLQLENLQREHRTFVDDLRTRIINGEGASALASWVKGSHPSATSAHSYDVLDTLVADILQLRDPGEPAALEDGMVFYQPTPARHALAFLHMASLQANDTLIDLGSGMGHLPLLAAIVSEARCIGIEQDASMVYAARECAESLKLKRAAFFTADARMADLHQGTVFYLYSPFSGAMLAQMIERLRLEASQRTIRLGVLGPCVAAISAQTWLRALTPVSEHQPVLFESIAR